MAALDAAIAKNIWRYDPETGHFFWLVKPKYDVEVGSRAGSFDGKYWRLRWRGKSYKASRVAWLIMVGEWPNNQIDHVNMDKTDDRFSNLREATPSQNSRNRNYPNSLGVKGVTKVTNRKNLYAAQIRADGRHIYLGCFPSIEAAKDAYDAAAIRLHGEFAKL